MRVLIVFLGVALSFVASVVAAPGTDGARFEARRAFADLAALAAIGPRASGSDGARRARSLIMSRLRQAGVITRQDAFETDGVNVIGERAGRSDAIVIVASHYDSKAPGPAANEAASGPALLLELARALSGRELEASVWFVFFDGHDDDFRGSRTLAARLERDGVFPRVRALVVVERVADTDLRLETSLLASRALLTRALRVAEGTEPPLRLDPRATAHFDGDHLPFVRKGLREVLPLIDRNYGPGEAPGAWTDTPGDDLRRVSATSLSRAGELVRRLVLDLAGARSPSQVTPTSGR